MKTIESKRYEEHTIILEQGRDYLESELEPDQLIGGKLYNLPCSRLNEIAHRKGFDRWAWSGNAQRQEALRNKMGVKVKFVKIIM